MLCRIGQLSEMFFAPTRIIRKMSACAPVVRVCVLGVGDHDEGGVELVQHEAAAQGQPGADRVQEAEQLLARHHLQYIFKRRLPKIIGEIGTPIS